MSDTTYSNFRNMDKATMKQNYSDLRLIIKAVRSNDANNTVVGQFVVVHDSSRFIWRVYNKATDNFIMTVKKVSSDGRVVIRVRRRSVYRYMVENLANNRTIVVVSDNLFRRISTLRRRIEIIEGNGNGRDSLRGAVGRLCRSTVTNTHIHRRGDQDEAINMVEAFNGNTMARIQREIQREYVYSAVSPFGDVDN